MLVFTCELHAIFQDCFSCCNEAKVTIFALLAI